MKHRDLGIISDDGFAVTYRTEFEIKPGTWVPSDYTAIRHITKDPGAGRLEADIAFLARHGFTIEDVDAIKELEGWP